MGVAVKKVSHDNVWEWLLEHAVCASVVAGRSSTNWLTYRCLAACSRTVLLRPETLDQRWLTVWTVCKIWKHKMDADRSRIVAQSLTEGRDYSATILRSVIAVIWLSGECQSNVCLLVTVSHSHCHTVSWLTHVTTWSIYNQSNMWLITSAR